MIHQMLENTCSRCEVTFDQWTLYRTHILDKKCFKKLLAKNISGRTKAQIVNDAEQTWLGKYLIPKQNKKETIKYNENPTFEVLTFADIAWLDINAAAR